METLKDFSDLKDLKLDGEGQVKTESSSDDAQQNGADSNTIRNEMKKWTDDEVRFLIENKDKDHRLLAEILERGIPAVEAMLWRLKDGDLQDYKDGDMIKEKGRRENWYKRWSNEEISYVANNYITMSALQMADKLSRNESSVRYIINQVKGGKIDIKLKSGEQSETKTAPAPEQKTEDVKFRKRLSVKEIKFIIQNRKLGVKWLSEQTGRTEGSIVSTLWRIDNGNLKHYLDSSKRDDKCIDLPEEVDGDYTPSKENIGGVNSNKSWSKAEIKRVIIGNNDGVSAESLAKELGRSERAIKTMIGRINSGEFRYLVKKVEKEREMPIEKRLEKLTESSSHSFMVKSADDKIEERLGKNADKKTKPVKNEPKAVKEAEKIIKHSGIQKPEPDKKTKRLRMLWGLIDISW